MELLRLQNEVREFCQQNFDHQKNIRYIPFNIISNNLYINNSLNKSSINSNIRKNNSLFNSLISGREIQKKKKLEQKKRIPFGKLPLKRGMFSYKTSLNNNNVQNNNYNDLVRSQSQNIIEVNEPIYNNINNNKYYNNNSLLSAELKLNLDDNYGEGDINIEQNKGMGNKVFSSSSLDLNKYKINKNNIINQKKNILISNNQRMNFSNRILNITPNNFQSNTNKSYNFNINQNQLEKININSIDINNNLSMIVGNKKKKIRKIADHFKKNPKNEKESRRMIIELIKILNKKEFKNKKNITAEDIENVMEKNNISKKVLNKEYSKEELNSMNAFNNPILENNKFINNINNSNVNSKRNLLNNSIESNSISPNYKDIKNNTKSTQKSLFTPIKKNINNFLMQMNDAKKDKIKLINFLSIPRIMHLYFMNQKYTYIFVLCPNIICYKEAIESYIFKFADINTKQYIGGFDLIKVKLCSKLQNKPNHFYIETFDGKTNRNYEFETISANIAGYYVKAINYLSQLVKCKIYDFKSIYKK